MSQNISSIDQIASIFSKATKMVLEMSTQKTITYSKTILKVPKVSIRPEIGCFVPFNGDYNGLIVFNFSDEAAMKLYKGSMTAMGIPEQELAKDYTSSEVPDSIGEITNQIMGQSMRLVEDQFNLTSYCGQPKALALNSAITLTIDSDYRDNRRIVFSIEGSKFYLELAMETIEFISI